MLHLNITGITAQEATGYIIAGLRAKQAAIAEQIACVEECAPETGYPAPKAKASARTANGKRQMSPEARARISQAQHDRWAKVKRAEHKATKGQPILTAEMDQELEAGDIALAAV